MSQASAAGETLTIRYRSRRCYLALCAMAGAVSGWVLVDTIASGRHAGPVAVLMPLWFVVMIALELLISAHSAVELTPDGITVTNWHKHRWFVPWHSYRRVSIEWPLLAVPGPVSVLIVRGDGCPVRTWLSSAEARRLLAEIELRPPRPEASAG